MLCPKCYGRLDKKQQRCQTCGFNLSELDGATNKEAKKARKTIYKDDILYTTKIPADVSKKKLLLFAIFLGMFGVHNFYIGRFWKGLYMCAAFTISLTFGIIVIAMNTIYDNIIQRIAEFFLFFQGLALIIWIWDIFRIAFERYKIPVYKDEFSKK